LSDRYLDGIPDDSRAHNPTGFLKSKDIDERRLAQIRALRQIARERSQSLAQMALAWALRDERMTSVLIGASKVRQIEENAGALANLTFNKEELRAIDAIAN
jgi:L-glyceraldehyde 3-phosphate reductase